jgi:hypothetical protein
MDRLNVRNIIRRRKHKLEGNNYTRMWPESPNFNDSELCSIRWS